MARFTAQFYIKNQYTEQIVEAQQESHARNIIEGMYKKPGVDFRWSRTPQLTSRPVDNGHNYICSYYIDGQFTEETINAQTECHARRLIEARFAGYKGRDGRPGFKWSRTPQLA